MLVTQLPCIIMSPIKWDYWLRALPCSLRHQPGVGNSMELKHFSGLTHSPWQGDHPLQGRKTSFLLKIAPDAIFQWCPSCELSACEEPAGKQKEGSHRGLGTGHLRMDVLCSTSSWLHLCLAVRSTSTKHCGEASRKKANKRRVMLWWLLWAETSC